MTNLLILLSSKMYFQVQDKEPRLTGRKKSLYKDSQHIANTILDRLRMSLKTSRKLINRSKLHEIKFLKGLLSSLFESFPTC